MPGSLSRVPTRARGYVVLIDNETGKVLDEGETLMCAHCQKHWVVRPGSGITRGWCFRCAGPTCGKQPCVTGCTPFEVALEVMESRLTLASALHRIRGL